MGSIEGSEEDHKEAEEATSWATASQESRQRQASQCLPDAAGASSQSSSTNGGPGRGTACCCKLSTDGCDSCQVPSSQGGRGSGGSDQAEVREAGSARGAAQVAEATG